MLVKGFSSERELGPFADLLEGTPHHLVTVADDGFDIRPYFTAAQMLPYRYCCFLNSYSRIAGDDWLVKLHAELTRPGVGVVGATGSHESPVEGHRRAVAGAPSPRSLRGLTTRFRTGRFVRRLERDFEPFPNPHIRTNGFMIERETMLSLRFDGEEDKLDSLRFESGKHGMTRQILGRGLRVLVVGREGRAYEPEKWAESRTFRSAEQENLLIADNRTDEYADGDDETRAFLRELAWGR